MTHHRWARRACLSLALFGTIALALPASAHEPLRSRIDELGRRIASDPDNAGLYIERADLLRLNEQPQRAEADLATAERLVPGTQAVEIIRAAMLNDAGRWVAAERKLDDVIARAPGLIEARTMRAEVRVSLGRIEDAVADLDAAIASSRRSLPDLYLERARLLATLGPGGIDRALAGLDAGLERIGSSPALEDFAVDLEARRGHTDDALERIARQMARAPHQEMFLARRGEILAAAGRTVEAWAAYSEALTAIESLPRKKRSAPMIVALEERVRAALRTPASGSTTEEVPR